MTTLDIKNTCRHCGTALGMPFLDLGIAPPSNNYLNEADLHKPEKKFPLRIRVCENCWLVQTEDFQSSEDLFKEDYAYFSSTSTTWLMHAKEYCEKITNELKLDAKSLVIEVASNDGYLLKNFVSKGVPCLGIEPTKSTATESEKLGIPVIQNFLTEELADDIITKYGQADLVLGNNVFAHVPNINDFSISLKKLLKPNGTITLEFPHLLNLLKYCQFDTVYHEHYSYLSAFTASKIFKSVGLRIYNIEKLNTHGGSLRIYGCHIGANIPKLTSVDTIIEEEVAFGINNSKTYSRLQEYALKLSHDLRNFLIEQKSLNKSVVAYGAAAKGITFINFSEISKDLIPAVYDAAKSKQGKYLPGSHIPILDTAGLYQSRPDWIVILPWNIAPEIIQSFSSLTKSGTRFVVAMPELKCYE
jgi:2-polyprenyl-3-methyl-5-hydroxy-6-metoxy-1,4-benzoquinol methylase